MSYRRRRNIVEAEQTRCFFDEVLFDREIEAKRWRRNDEVRAVTDRLEAKTRKDVRERQVGNFDAQNARNPLRANTARVGSRHRSEHVDHRARLPAAKLEDELCRTIDSAIRIVEIDATLETEPGAGGKTETARFSLDHRGAPERAFEKNARGRAADAAVLAAHNARQSQRLLLVGDKEEIGFERELLAVQQRQRFTVLGKAHDQIALEYALIIGMQRLPELQHHVVGHVDHRRDRPDAAALEALFHPHRSRGSRVDAADHAAAKARACLRILDSNTAR